MHRRKGRCREDFFGASTKFMVYRCCIHLYTYMLEDDDNYEMLKPQNKEHTVTGTKSFRLGKVQNGALFEHVDPAAGTFLSVQWLPVLLSLVAFRGGREKSPT